MGPRLMIMGEVRGGKGCEWLVSGLLGKDVLPTLDLLLTKGSTGERCGASPALSAVQTPGGKMVTGPPWSPALWSPVCKLPGVMVIDLKDIKWQRWTFPDGCSFAFV